MLCMHLILLLIIKFGFLKTFKSKTHCFQLFQRFKEPWEFMKNPNNNHSFVGNYFIVFYFLDNDNYKLKLGSYVLKIIVIRLKSPYQWQFGAIFYTYTQDWFKIQPTTWLCNILPLTINPNYNGMFTMSIFKILALKQENEDFLHCNG
jgi:hypothetical protein